MPCETVGNHRLGEWGKADCQSSDPSRGRIRNLARSVAASYLDSRARLGFPMAPKDWADEVLEKLSKEKLEKDKKAA